MYIDTKKVAFGRHESFALRFGWLTKGYQAFEEDRDIFTKDDAVVELGVGRNMVNSIRHWLRAAQLIHIENETKETTSLGEFLFAQKDGVDPYLEDEGTIWLLHWLIATNPEQATLWFWFFNMFHKPEFTSQELANAIIDYAKENITAKCSVTTIKKDCSVLTRCYVQSIGNNKIPVEDALDSPLSTLGLISYSSTTKTFQSRLDRREHLPVGIFGYAIVDLLKKSSTLEIPIKDLMYSKDGAVTPGLVFRLTEEGLLTKLEQLVELIPGTFRIDETAGIHQLYLLDNIEPFDCLEKHYFM